MVFKPYLTIFFFKVVFDAYVQNSLTIVGQLGGHGKTVEIDESKFGRRKYYRGHFVDGCWVFGGIERESGEVFLQVVDKRYANKKSCLYAQ